MKKLLGLFVCVGLLSIGLLAAWHLQAETTTQKNAGLAEYEVENLSCGSCVTNISEALAALPGVVDVDVNLTRHRVQVTYGHADVRPDRIAEVITASGYPATLKVVLTAEEYSAIKNEERHLGQKYLAKIGTRLLDRSTFDELLELKNKGQSSSGMDNSSLIRSTWDELLNKELLLFAAEMHDTIVQDGEVELQIEELRQQHPGLDMIIEMQFSNTENFRKSIREDLTINKFLEENILVGIRSPYEKQQKIQHWFNQHVKETNVTIFDQRLKNLVSSSSGCGGSCCG